MLVTVAKLLMEKSIVSVACFSCVSRVSIVCISYVYRVSRVSLVCLSYIYYRVSSWDPVSFYSYKFAEKNFPKSRFTGKSIIQFINLTYYWKLRIIQCFLGDAQWLNVSIHVLTSWSFITPKSRPCGVSVRDCVCVTLRIRRVVCIVTGNIWHYRKTWSCN